MSQDNNYDLQKSDGSHLGTVTVVEVPGSICEVSIELIGETWTLCELNRTEESGERNPGDVVGAATTEFVVMD